MIAIVDYGVGNLFSLKSSFASLGQAVTVTGDARELRRADRLILPGVGAFADAAAKLRASGLAFVLTEECAAGKPLLGICLGMQLLFTKSYEYGEHAGLGLIPGAVVPIRPLLPPGYKVPHIGWNALSFPKDRPRGPLFAKIPEGEYFYFVHSYYAADCEPYVTSTAEYGVPLTASAERGNVYGTQFHPEKSGEAGLLLLRAFSEI